MPKNHAMKALRGVQVSIQGVLTSNGQLYT
jgi:hypothetical protein